MRVSCCPPEYRGAVLEVDAGTRQVNFFPLTRKGAAFRTEYKVFLAGDDPWFRPVDACTAPDGSVFVADWYDAGVGGHAFSDQTTGRIYRVAPQGHKSQKIKVDFATSRRSDRRAQVAEHRHPGCCAPGLDRPGQAEPGRSRTVRRLAGGAAWAAIRSAEPGNKDRSGTCMPGRWTESPVAMARTDSRRANLRGEIPHSRTGRADSRPRLP